MNMRLIGMIKAIALYLMVGLQVIALADNCSNALSACQTLVNAQDTSITMLKQEVKILESDVATAEDKEAKMPWYVYVLTGAAAGFIAGAIIK